MSMIADLFIKLGFKADEFNKGVDASKKKLTDFGGAASEAGNKISSVFGISLDSVKSKLLAVTGMFSGLIDSFKSAATGGAAAAAANEALTAATAQVAATQAAQAVAQATFTTLQASGTVSAEAMALAEAEVATTSAAATAAIVTQSAAQSTLTAATTVGAIAMNILKVAMISTGIGALVVGVGSLVAYFTMTKDGANAVKVALAEIGAVGRVLIDRFSSIGEGLMKLFGGDWKGAAAAFKASVAGIGDDLKNEAAAAGDLAKRQQANNKLERDNIVLQQERRTATAQARAEAKEEGKTGAEKVALLDKAKKLIKETSALDIKIQAENSAISIAKRQMHKESSDDLKADEEDKAKVLVLQEAEARELKGLSREYKAAGLARKKEIEDELQLRQLTAESNAALSKPMVRHEEIKKIIKQTMTVNPDTGQLETSQKGMLNTAPVGLQESTTKLSPEEAAQNAKHARVLESEQKFNEDLNNLIGSGMANAASTFGEGLAGLMTGDMNLGEFGASLLGMVGSFITQLGQLFIATAIGMIAFNAGLKSMNPVLMLGAGIALVAAGAMVSSFAKKGMTGASSSAGGGGGSSAASGYSGKQNQSNAAESFGANVTFEIQGNKLIGVMNNQDRRNQNFK